MESRDLGFDVPSTAFGPIEEWPLGRLFGTAAQRSGAVYARLVDEARPGTSLSGFLMLRLLVGRDGQRPGELARQLMVTPATVTTVADTLERNGHLERRRDAADRRVVRLHITPSGTDLVDRTAARMLPHLRDLYGFVDPEDEPAVRRFLLGLIERYNALLSQDGPADTSSAAVEEAAEDILDALMPDELPDDLVPGTTDRP
ncbi:MarR family winged helix-turn-helix transcriptional regulator [Actinomadura hibisca]|uniref:MarR family winged helix-turn-helix transcriptional regulator n=1 Tax=Actinomadura hibisca TaxID=68565 RepID=UPI000834A2A5|nr:MarR family transcriptional regulator [Actinomadura hibisca]